MKLPSLSIFRASLAIPAILAAANTPAPTPEIPRFTPEMQKWVENFKPGAGSSALAGRVPLLPPAEAHRRLKPADGYVVELVAHEPAVRQPIDLEFDARGRLWVAQYLQFPFAAGITVTNYDEHMRAEFNRMPPPPPAPPEFRGVDHITILEDTDGDGKFDKAKDFLSDLNLCTSIALDHDGVWVMQPPYLLYYPDRDHNDVPDGNPEVHLAGFGLEDTHSLASSLQWGPDGWLYGAHGSTSTFDIHGEKLLGQGIWRYHPRTRKFEVFAEGGGNTWSFEFDRFGRAYSGTNNGNTRGVHYVQGATYNKNWPKHGPARNPFLFGFFPHMALEGDTRRFAQAMLLYEGDALSDLRGQFIAGMALTNRVQASRLFQDTSTYRTVDGLVLIDSEDKAFRPVNLEDGPDGCIYVADWYDSRIGHANPTDNWDKSTGRIYRIAPAGMARPGRFDLLKLSTPELMALLTHPNRWQREQARRLLAHRPEAMAPALAAMLDRETGEAALEALWVLHLRGEIDRASAGRYLRHANEHVRRWMVRLLGDANHTSPELAQGLAALARLEPNVEVRSQLASTARRLPAEQGLPIVRELLARNEDAADKHLPLLLWWAIESKADADREAVLALAGDPAVWKTKIFARDIAPRLGRRYTADQGRSYYTVRQGVYSTWLTERDPARLFHNLDTCARLLAAVPDAAAADLLVAGMAEGLTGAPVHSVPPALQQRIAELWRSRPSTIPLAVLGARLGQPQALATAFEQAQKGALKPAEEQQIVALFGATGYPAALPYLATRLRVEKDDLRRGDVLTALKAYPGDDAAKVVIEAYPRLSLRLRSVAQRMLSETPAWALAMLQGIDGGTFEPGALSATNVALIRAHQNPPLDALLTRTEQRKRSDPVELAAQKLFDQGKLVYSQICSTCHQVDGTGIVGLAPSLITSPWVQKREPVMARIVLHGKESNRRGLMMPPLGFLSDDQIAAALTYVLREFGNQDGAVTPARVGAIRSATSSRTKPWSDDELSRALE